MMHVIRLEEHSEPALVDDPGQRHRLTDRVTATADREEQHRVAVHTPGPVGVGVARILAQTLAQRPVLLYLLDGVRWPRRMRGRHVHTN